jgi:uncharacterized protein
MFKRSLKLPTKLEQSFFLWGARQTGKSTLLKKTYPDVTWIDLLKSEEFRKYISHPERLREELILLPKGSTVVIDEIQKVPSLLNEVHWLIENHNIKFALCGSSARKLRKGHANILGGRAVRHELFGLVYQELTKDFNLDKILNNGYLPRHYLSKHPRKLIDSYISDYLKEEIAAEGLTRNLPSFSSFLNIASLSDSEIVNFSNIARECGVSNNTVKEYFQILEDTLLAKWLPSYRKRPKRRVITSPKFYFSDVGVVNILAKRGFVEQGSELYGKTFENYIFHELSAYNSYKEKFFELSYWRLPSGIEVDFIINDAKIAIEAKTSQKVTSDHLKGLRELKIEFPKIKKRILVCLEKKPRLTEDKILILPYRNFLEQLWNGNII